MKIKSLVYIFTMFLTFSLVGCSTSVGTSSLLDQSILDSLVIGKSTKKDATVKLGRPLSTNSSGQSGVSRWTYSYTKRAIGAMAFVPGAALLTGSHGESAEHISLTLTFNRNGVLTNKDVSGSQVGG